MFCFVQYLLNQPNVIITSRPTAKLPVDLKKVDLQLETIGFYSDQVDTYLRKVFCDQAKVIEVQSFLQKYSLVQSLVWIPIQLDALCYTWDTVNEEDIPQTMTAVYQAIEQRL